MLFREINYSTKNKDEKNPQHEFFNTYELSIKHNNS